MLQQEEELMSFQEDLLNILYSCNDPNIIMQKLCKYQQNPLLSKWLESFSSPMVEVAARMTQCWAKKS